MQCTSNYCCTKIKNLSVTKPGIDILSSINLHIHCGELTAIIGPNGAGKSTLLKALIGEIKYAGSLDFINERGEKHSPKIGYVPQKISNTSLETPLTVMEFIASSLGDFPICVNIKAKKRHLAIRALEQTSSAHLAKRRLADLSGGEMQRVMLSFALCPVPNLLLLDEPIAGLDHNGIANFWDCINDIRLNNDIAIIIISHDFEQVKKYANNVILLNKTILLNAKPDDMFKSAEFKKIF